MKFLYNPYALLIIVNILFYLPLMKYGMITFSDISVGTDTSRYMEEIFGLWNQRYNTTTMLNLPRLFIVLPSYLFAYVFGSQWLTKSFILLISIASSLSQFHFTHYLLKTYIVEKNFKNYIKISCFISALYYSFNPWFLIRIQHTYLLCGYALFPLIIHYYFKIYNQKYADQNGHRADYYILSTLISVGSAAIHYFFFAALSIGTLIFTGLLKKLKTHEQPYKKILFVEFKKTAVFASMTLLSCTYWLVPYIYATLTGKLTKQANINVEETLDMFSRHSSVWNVVTNNSYWWPMTPGNTPPDTSHLGWYVLLFTILMGSFRFLKNNNLIALLSAFTILLCIISTGTYYPEIAFIHEFLVFSIPVFGNIFRDPNKLSGIISFFYATFIALGTLYFLNRIKKNIFRLLTVSLISLSILLAVLPYYRNFILNLYSPIETPVTIKETHEKVQNTNNKITILPTTEERIDRSKKIAHLTWNKNNLNPSVGKSIGEIYSYASKKDITFQYEGNSPIVGYYYRYLQNMIDQGKSRKIGHLLTGIFSDELIFQKGFSKHEELEQSNEIILTHQTDLSLIQNSPFSNLYRNNSSKLGDIDINASLIATPQGLSRAGLYQYTDNYNFDKKNIVFTAQADNPLSIIYKTNLIFDYKDFNNLLLSTISDNYRLHPFDYINTSLPFLKWSKSSIYKHEWSWFMESMGFNRRNYSIERTGGIVATFSSARLNTKSYNLKYLKGKKYKGLNELINNDKKFIESQSDKLNIQVFPDTKTKDTTILGALSPEQKDKIWRVAKTKQIRIKESNPYSILTSISGREAKSVHIKLYFLDKNSKEIGVNYVSRPEKIDNFDRVTFKTFFVTPKDATFIKVGILSEKKENKKIFWWLHQFDIYDLEEHKEKNNIKINYLAKEKGLYKAYARVFQNPKGGLISFKMGNNKNIEVDSKSKLTSQFVWSDLGLFQFKHANEIIEVNNISGFNALSDIIIIPQNKLIDISHKLEAKLKSSRRISAIEGELDFSKSSILQTNRNYPSLSGGQGVSVFNKPIQTNIDFKKDRDIQIQIVGRNISKDTFKIELLNDNNKFELSPSNNEKVSLTETLFTKRSPYNGRFEINHLEKGFDVSSVSYKDLHLPKGNYKIVLSPNLIAKNLVRNKDLKKLYTTVRALKTKERKEKICCECLYDDGLSSKSKSYYKVWETYTRNTCQWHIIQSKPINVHTDSEYLISYNFYNVNNNESHQKIIYLDDKNQEVGKYFIDQTDNDLQKKWLNKKLLITPPPNSKKMIVLFLFKGTKQKRSKLALSNLEILNHSLLPMIDYILIEEPKEMNHSLARIDSGITQNGMDRHLKLDTLHKNGSITLNQPLHRIWSVQYDNKDTDSFVSNGFLHTIQNSSESGSISLTIKIRFIYWLGIIIHLIFISLAISNISRNNKKYHYDT